MSDSTHRPKFERTPEQKAEERRLRELHRQHPIREIPTDTLRGEDVVRLLKFVASMRRLREEQGLTVEQLAGKAGIEPNVLARMEAGQAFNPTVATLFGIAAALGKKLSLAFEGTVPPEKNGASIA
jgi:ribosome-binding protein aMBF1 (putative translation factor)